MNSQNTPINRPQAAYRQIADRLREQIVAGVLLPGSQLPTMSVIAEEYGVSHQTALRAVGVLRGEKLVTSAGRRGVFVRQDALTAESGQQLAKNPTGAPNGDRVEITSAGIVTSPAYVGDLLGFNADAGNARVSRREAVTYRDGKPYRLSVSWAAPWAYEAVPELLEPTLINGLRAIKDRTGRKAVQEKWWFVARTADEREARHLGIEVGDVVLAGTSIWVDEAGEPVEYREFVVPSGYVVSGESDIELD